MGEVSFYDRLMSCKHEGETLKKSARRTGISYSSLSAYRRGRVPWVIPSMVEIGRNLNMNPVWLGCLHEDAVRGPFGGESTN